MLIHDSSPGNQQSHRVPSCMYICIYVCMYVYMYTCMYVCMYICIYVCMYVCIYVYMYVCIYVYMYTFYICTFTYVLYTLNTSDLSSIMMYNKTWSTVFRFYIIV